MLEQIDKIRIYGMTTLNKKLVDRARKIALMMQSPFEHEVIVAARLLKQLLDNHNITLNDLGLKKVDLNRIMGMEAATKTTNLRDVIRTTGTSHEVSSKGDCNQIREILYKHLITEMDLWFLCVLVKIAHAYEVLIIGDRYGTWADKSYYLKIIGFPEDVEHAKSAIVSIRYFIETQISKSGYVHITQIANYAFGIADTITQRIKEDVDRRSTYESRLLTRSKSAKLAAYVYKSYGLTTDCDDPIDLGRDDDAYRTGLYDGHNFFRQNSCKEALLAALKKRSETKAMERVG